MINVLFLLLSFFFKPLCTSECPEAYVRNLFWKRGAADAMTRIINEESCEAHAPILGRLVLRAHERGFVFDFVDTLHTCTYSFYQGVFQEVKSKDTYSVLPGFCDQMERNYTPRTWESCWFGLGHGIVWLSMKENIEINEGFANEVVSTCQKLTKDQKGIYDCVSGAFDALNLSFVVGLRDLDEVLSAMSSCRNLEPDYDSRCYKALVHSIYYKANKDIVEAYKILSTIEDKTIREEVMTTMASTLVFEPLSVSQVVEDCKKLAKKTEEDICLLGYPTGLLEIANGGEEHKLPIEFCLSTAVDEGRKIDCISNVFKDMSIAYGKDIWKTCLNEVPEEYTASCIPPNENKN